MPILDLELTRETYVAKLPSHVSCDLYGEEVILNLQDGVYYGLDPVGTTIWHLLDSPRTVEEICDALLQEYEVQPERCESDLRQLLKQLHQQQLIEVRHGTMA